MTDDLTAAAIDAAYADGSIFNDERPVTTRELADFDPSTGHLHDCDAPRTSEQCNHDPDCAGHLYAIAEDAEHAIARVRALCTDWDALSKRETATTAQIRAALGTA